MNTNPLKRIALLLLCSLFAVPLCRLEAATTNSTWAGQSGDKWSDASKWNPAVVPNNNGATTFNVTDNNDSTDEPGIVLDVDVAINRFTITADNAWLTSSDHNFTAAASSIAANFPDEEYGGAIILLKALHRSSVLNLGELADFSGTTLNGGNYVVLADHADPGVTSTIRFNNADVHTNNGDIQLAGAGSRFTDQNGQDAIRHFDHNLVNGVFLLATGRSFNTGGSFLNEGLVELQAEFGGAYGNTILTINGDYRSIGYPLDPDTVGLTVLTAAGPTGDAKVVINGALANYDAHTKTLDRSYWVMEAANGRSATIQVGQEPGKHHDASDASEPKEHKQPGGDHPLDIVTSNAAIILFGPNTGFLDKNGHDALHHLTTSARLLLGDRAFTTHDSFTTTSRLSVYGGSQFTVNGNLTERAGFLEVSPLTGYAREGEDGFPTDPPYLRTNLGVKKNYTQQAGTILRFHIFNTATPATIAVGKNAQFAGSLEASVEDPSQISSADSFQVLTAKNIIGNFTNVASGGRLNAYAQSTSTGENVGAPVGTFLVTITRTAIILSDFQPAS